LSATACWAIALLVGLLWPSRLIGPLDGAPLDQRLEVVALAVLVPALSYLCPSFLRTTFARATIATLALWKIATWFLVAQTGWCGLFASKYVPPIDSYRVERSWDARTFWSGRPPGCTAIVARPYRSQLAYPAWILNIPFPADYDFGARMYSLPTENPRPPGGVHALFVDGWVYPGADGTLAFDLGADVTLSGSIGRVPLPPRSGSVVRVPLAAGAHAVELRLDLVGRDWRFVPTWNGANVFTALTTSLTAMTAAQRMFARWATWVTPALIVVLLCAWAGAAYGALAARRVAAWTVASAALLFVIGMASARPTARLAVVGLLGAAAVRVPERFRTCRGAFLLFGLPWLAFSAGRAMIDVGRFQLYLFGDDALTFQRYAHRIFMQGYWLEGGERTFWNQPLYRWTNGVLHLAFGDSSVGEALADAVALLIGALFAFEVVRRVSTFRAGILAGVLTLVTIVLGPNWYLLGRGLSELSATAWLYLACFALLGASDDAWRAAALAGLCAMLAFFTRLNHLPLVLVLVALTLPLSLPAAALTHLSEVWRRLPKRAASAYLLCIGAAVTAFAARTWYYTGVWSVFAGTTREHNGTGLSLTWSSLASGETWRRAVESVLMIVTVQDPPRFDIRAVLVVGGVIAAAGALLNAPLLRRLPLSLVLCCLGAIAGGLVARGVAYPGRFSVHLIPMAVALSVCTVTALSWNSRFAAK
jgi:hypothetical protein